MTAGGWTVDALGAETVQRAAAEAGRRRLGMRSVSTRTTDSRADQSPGPQSRGAVRKFRVDALSEAAWSVRVHSGASHGAGAERRESRR